MTKRLLSSPEPNQMKHIIWQTGHHPVYFEKVNLNEMTNKINKSDHISSLLSLAENSYRTHETKMLNS